MKTGTPGLASGIHSGILPGRQKAGPHIRAPAFRSDLFLAGIFYPGQRQARLLQAAKAKRIRKKKKTEKEYTAAAQAKKRSGKTAF